MSEDAQYQNPAMRWLESGKTDEINAALAKAQGAFPNPEKDRENPHFKSRYASLASAIDATREALAANELAVTQVIRRDGNSIDLVTTLRHSSGQWITSEYPLFKANAGPQPFGSELTYARRYSYSGILRLAADEDDDDGETAQRQPARNQSRGNQKRQETEKPKPKEKLPLFSALRPNGEIFAAEGAQALIEWWGKLTSWAVKDGKLPTLRAAQKGNEAIFKALREAGHGVVVDKINAEIDAACKDSEQKDGK
ncbi:ERF family protein [Acidocella aminolytica]|uniref:Transcriptional regulator ERF n=1 Tax=Acidocella aminolytica 101 = DSM 11237 TaxID=1120923 RepID=A0A0D6PDT1_9PROT|nr:ERF family protein [Acidocella aminolytica]GAN79817.1 transcriptional regulator ERF [Acidocella aminolytica 101 = DSM 11237]GBQ34346.1 hypothetical protein AA11237_0722 [Acidocella aminolytica 101 = DSM 11237]SHF36333.1 ERF superfamily protein [Acidocella aminolytica 101 = DSM 11237]